MPRGFSLTSSLLLDYHVKTTLAYPHTFTLYEYLNISLLGEKLQELRHDSLPRYVGFYSSIRGNQLVIPNMDSGKVTVWSVEFPMSSS